MRSMRALLLWIMLLAPAWCDAPECGVPGCDVMLSQQSVQILSAFKPNFTARELPGLFEDPDLQVPLGAGVTYKVEAYIVVTEIDAVAGFQWDWVTPAHVLANSFVTASETDANAGFNAGTDTGGAWADVQTIALAAGSETHFIHSGTITTTAPGTLILRWGKAVASVGPGTAVQGGSWLTAQLLF